MWCRVQTTNPIYFEGENMKNNYRLAACAVALALTVFVGLVQGADDVKVVTISGNDTMQFDVKAFEVKAGQKVKLIFKNVGMVPKVAMGHNLIVLNQGIASLAFGPKVLDPSSGASLATDWIPTNKDLVAQMLKYTKLLGPGEEDTIEFTAPDKPGTNEYLCSFPGHFALMRGVMTVK